MLSNSPARSLPALRARLGRVCIALTGSSPGDLMDKAEAVVRENPFLEFRLDYLPRPAEAMEGIGRFMASHAHATVIATCRRLASGGRFKGSAAAQIETLSKAAAGCQLVDLEIETAEAVKKADYERLHAQAALVLSFHDFERTRGLDDTLARMRRYPAEFYKVVSTARTLADNLAMIRFVERNCDAVNGGLVGLCMGEPGVISRVLGLRAGSAFTFAAAAPGEETGPGQIAARTLHEVYRIDQVDAATRVYGVAGHPIGHSLSPIMLNTAFRRETVNAVYLALQTKSVKDLFTMVRDVPIHGLSVTMPLKEEILPHLDRVDPLTRKIGACNTVFRSQEGKLFGFNTDVAGVVRPIEQRLNPRGARILVLGAGGAARAAVFGLVDKGAEVFILNRTPQTAQKLARQAGARTMRREQVAKNEFDVIVNATPVGMNAARPQSLLGADELCARYVFDMVYNPVETKLIRLAREKGVHVISGIEMFVQQGARQFEIWTGKPAPEEEMLRVVIHALRQRAQGKG